MTLQEWLTLKDKRPLSVRPGGTIGLLYADADESLWRLTDYAVRSVAAGVLWLCPRAIK